VEGTFLLDVVVGEGATVFELFAGEDESLSIGRNSLLVLDLLLDIVDGIARLKNMGVTKKWTGHLSFENCCEKKRSTLRR
jgi:hypothetical protein